MEFTKKEISLCKQIAERHRKDIEYGDWFYKINTQTQHLSYHKLIKEYPTPDSITPLWTISDCLEFLEEQGFKQGDIHFDENLEGEKMASVYIEISDKKGMFVKDVFKEGKTPLEACLKAVLAVLEEER